MKIKLKRASISDLANSMQEPVEKKDAALKKIRTKPAEAYVRKQKNIYRRAFSETQLLDAVGINFEEDESYHCLDRKSVV